MNAPQPPGPIEGFLGYVKLLLLYVFVSARWRLGSGQVPNVLLVGGEPHRTVFFSENLSRRSENIDYADTHG